MLLQKEKVADTIVYPGDTARKHSSVQEWNQSKYYENYQKHTLPSQVSPPKKRLGQHISTMPAPMFISRTAGFFSLISKTVEKPGFYKQCF